MSRDLEALRREIDRIDSKLLDLVVSRLKVAEEIGRVKVREGVPLTDKGRESEILERWRKRFKEEGFDPALADVLVEALFRVSKEVQRGVITDGEGETDVREASGPGDS